MESDALNQSRAIVEAYVHDCLTDALVELGEMADGTKSRQMMIEKARNVNSWLNLICGQDYELFNNYCIRLFEDTQGNVVYVCGKEINLDEEET